MSLTLPRWRVCILALFLLAALVRLIFVATLQPGFYFWDSVRYDNAAISLIENGHFGEYNRSPVYPIFLAGIYYVAGHSILAVRIVESLLGASIAVMLAAIGRRIAGIPTGLIAGVIWTFYPLAVFVAGLVYPETLMTTLIALGVLLFLQGSHDEARTGRPRTQCGRDVRARGRYSVLLLSGIPLFIAVLIKPVVAATILVLAAWLVFFAAGSRVRALGVFVAGLALPLVLWSGISLHFFGRILVSDPRSLSFVNKAGATTMEEVHKGRLQRALDDPGRFLSEYASEFVGFWGIYPERVTMSDQRMRDVFHQKSSKVVKKTVFGGNSLTFWASVLSIGPVLFLALIGAGLMLYERRLAEVTLVAGVVLSFAVAYSFFFTQLRYRIPVEPYIMVLTGYCISWIGERLLGRRQARVRTDDVVAITAE